MSCLNYGIKQPISRECTTEEGVFIKEMFLPDKDMVVPQHVHEFSHTTLVIQGRLRVWAGHEPMGDFGAFERIHIAAGVRHFMLSLEPKTLALCIHNGEAKVREETTPKHVDAWICALSDRPVAL